MKKILLAALFAGLSFGVSAQEGFVNPAGQGYSQGGFKGPTPGVASVAQVKTLRDDAWSSWKVTSSDKSGMNFMSSKMLPEPLMSILMTSAGWDNRYHRVIKSVLKVKLIKTGTALRFM